VQFLQAKLKWIGVLATVAFLPFLAAWQETPPLSLTVVVEPAIASSGDILSLSFTVTNTGSDPLEDVVVSVRIPRGTEWIKSQVEEKWLFVKSPGRTTGLVEFRAQSALAPKESAQLELVVLVRGSPGQSIVLDEYAVSAKGVSTPVQGERVRIWIDTTPTPTVRPSQTSTATPTATPTESKETPSPAPSVTPAATPTVVPTPTITVVIAELPPTPTSNLSSEQERVGTVTVSIFLFIVVVIIVLSVAWVIRSRREA